MGTTMKKIRELSFAAVDATPLDGTTANRTYQPKDRLITAASGTGACVLLRQDTDAVIITGSGTGSDGNIAVFHIYGYAMDDLETAASGGPAERIYITVTGTLGTAVAGTGQLYFDTFSGTDVHTSTIGIYDSGNNAVCKITFDTQGIKYLYFEPITFTTLTAIKFYIREVGAT